MTLLQSNKYLLINFTGKIKLFLKIFNLLKIIMKYSFIAFNLIIIKLYLFIE